MKLTIMYAIVIPPKYLGDLVRIREKSGVSIRKQILLAVEDHIIRDGKISKTAGTKSPRS